MGLLIHFPPWQCLKTMDWLFSLWSAVRSDGEGLHWKSCCLTSHGRPLYTLSHVHHQAKPKPSQPVTSQEPYPPGNQPELPFPLWSRARSSPQAPTPFSALPQRSAEPGCPRAWEPGGPSLRAAQGSPNQLQQSLGPQTALPTPQSGVLWLPIATHLPSNKVCDKRRVSIAPCSASRSSQALWQSGCGTPTKPTNELGNKIVDGRLRDSSSSPSITWIPDTFLPWEAFCGEGGGGCFQVRFCHSLLYSFTLSKYSATNVEKLCVCSVANDNCDTGSWATQSGISVSTRQLSSVLREARGMILWASNPPCPLLTKMLFRGTF